MTIIVSSMTFYLSETFALTHLHLCSSSGSTFEEKLRDVYDQFKSMNTVGGFQAGSILKQSIFFSATGNRDYLSKTKQVHDISNDFFNIHIPTAIISQGPEDDKIAIEFFLLTTAFNGSIEYHHSEKGNWVTCTKDDFKLVAGTGACNSSISDDILEQCNDSFRQVESILKNENLTFSDIVRQWNYIEQITGIRDEDGQVSQRYQVFNDVRTSFYQQNDFSNGYPAATGIGMDSGGIIIDFIAIRENPDISFVPIKSPVQKDAYQYTTDVLAENHKMRTVTRTSPKFERAKVLVGQDKILFISGTAAIQGQSSNPNLSARDHTEMTIQNILHLISQENLSHNGIKSTYPADVKQLRVYIKNKEDLKEVKSICQYYFPEVPSLFVISDICRPELLVEIEGMAIIPT